MATIFATARDLVRQLPEWMQRLTFVTTRNGKLYKDSVHKDESGAGLLNTDLVEVEPQDALLMSARRSDCARAWGEPAYQLLLDLDGRASLMPSSSPGHHHLAVDAYMSKEQHDAVMDALAEAGVISRVFADSAMSSEFGATIRPPWVSKQADKTWTQQQPDYTPPTEPLPAPAPAPVVSPF